MHSFNKYLPSTLWVPGLVLGPGGSAGSERYQPGQEGRLLVNLINKGANGSRRQCRWGWGGEESAGRLWIFCRKKSMLSSLQLQDGGLAEALGLAP